MMRHDDRYVDDARMYPPPIGDFHRGRPRSRTIDETPRLHRGPAADDSSPQSANGRPVFQEYHRPEAGLDRRRHVDALPREHERPPRHRESRYPSPRHEARATHGPQQQYESGIPRRAKSMGTRRPPERSPPRYRRYASPEPSQRTRQAARAEAGEREALRDKPRDIQKNPWHDPRRDPRHADRFENHGRSERLPARERMPERERGRERGRERDPDSRRGRTVHVPAYEDGYRPQPRRKASLDGTNRDGPSARQYHRRGPSPSPGRRRRHQSVPAKSKDKDAIKKGMLAGIAWQSVARTAFTAGAQAAFKARKDPSPWLGEKGARVATAAISAALVDGFIASKHPDKMDSKRHKGLKTATTVALSKGVREGLARRHR